MSVSNAQWAQIKQDLSWSHGTVHLKCDDYLISAQIRQIKMKLVVFVYVDGVFKGINAWHGQESQLAEMSAIARRFYCLSSKGPSAKITALTLKILGEKVCKEEGYLERSYTAWPEFATPGAFISHIKKHNPSIELLDHDRYDALRDLQRTQEVPHG